jgi:hypothetical protein
VRSASPSITRGRSRGTLPKWGGLPLLRVRNGSSIGTCHQGIRAARYRGSACPDVPRGGSHQHSEASLGTGPDLWPGQCRLTGRQRVRASSRAPLVRPHYEMSCDDRIRQEALAPPQGQGRRSSRIPRSGTFAGPRKGGRGVHDYRVPDLEPPLIAESAPALAAASYVGQYGSPTVS